MHVGCRRDAIAFSRIGQMVSSLPTWVRGWLYYITQSQRGGERTVKNLRRSPKSRGEQAEEV